MKTNNSPAQGMVEYALLILLVGAIAFLGLRLSGITAQQAYCDISSQLGNAEACTASANAYCQDDFSEGSQAWTNGADKPPSSNWTFSNGALCGSGGSVIYNTCASQMSAKDYTITLDNATLQSGNGYGIFFRSELINGKVNGYTFQYDPGLNAFVFRKWVDGRELTPFASVRIPNFDWYGEPHDIQIQVDGDTYTAYLDGVAILTAQDDTYSSGTAGLRTWDSTSFCTDGFSISPVQP
jgi:hypothetical protein